MVRFVRKSDIVRTLTVERQSLTSVFDRLDWGTIAPVRRWADRLAPARGLEFIDALFDELGLQIACSGAGIDQIPRLGPFVVIANHPFGLADSLMLIRLVASQRPDFRLVSPYPLHEIEPLSDFFLPPAGAEAGTPEHQGSLDHRMIGYLKAGHPLGIFPAGSVASIRRKDRRIVNKPWDPAVAKLIHTAAAPVVPVYFEGSNSLLFHVMGLLDPRLRDRTISRETLRKQNQTLRMCVGRPISPRLLAPLEAPEKLSDYLRARTYSLRNCLQHSGEAGEARPVVQAPLPPGGRARQQEIVREVAALDASCLLCAQQQFEVYCASSQHIPQGLEEIGRLRETTFRQVGEGTGKEKDLDAYDAYYLHLFLWDKEKQQIAGAYRMGRGDEILAKKGMRGFYIRSLFKIDPAFRFILEKSVELGRSFILPEYQRQRLPLFLLWKGIHNFLRRHPAFRYLIGPVSISNDYSTLSRAYICGFIHRHYFDWEMAAFIKPKKRFRPKISETEVVKGLLQGDSPDLREVDAVIASIEPRHTRLPVLLKKYIRQNAKIIGFNIDPDFNHCLDGLILLDLNLLPDTTGDMMED